MQKKKFVSVILTVGILILSITGCGSSTDTFKKHVNNGDYSKAIEIYNKSIAGNSGSENAARSILQDFLDETWANYVDGKIGEQEFLDCYTTVEKINDKIQTIYTLDSVHEQYLYIKESKDSYSKAVEFIDEGNLEEAIGAFSNVVPEDSANYDNAKDKMSELIDNYQEGIIANARQLAETDSYEEAITCIQKAENIAGSTTELENCLSELYTQKYTHSLDAAYSSNDYVTFIKEYSEANNNSYIQLSSDMTAKYSSCVTNYLDDLSQKAEGAFGDNADYSAAIRVLQAAIPDLNIDKSITSEIEEKIEYYQEFIPVSLTSLDYTQKTQYIVVGGAYDSDAMDVNENLYDANTVIYPTGGSLGSDVASTDDESYVLYNLNFKYSTLTGTIYRPYRSLSSEDEWKNNTIVKIFGDEVLLYEAPNITKNTYDVIDFKVDITGVRNLKIVMRGVWNSPTGWGGLYNRNPKVCMAEVNLQK